MVAPDVRRIEVEWLPEDLERERERAERLEEELAEEQHRREAAEAERDELRRRLEEVEGRGGEDAETTAQELHQRLEEVRQSPERADEGLTPARPAKALRSPHSVHGGGDCSGG
jgi:chromosome segregation ATPase